MRYSEWKYRTTTEKKYIAALLRVSRFIDVSIKNLSTIPEILAKLDEITNSKAFQDYATISAFNMVKSVSVDNARTWREAARNSRPAKTIHLMLKKEFATHPKFRKIIQNNAKYITRMPADLSQAITNKASKEALKGKRAGDLVDYIKETVPGISNNRAKLIARTEIAKTNATITEIRSADIGSNWYIWRTMKDSRVRSSHDYMEGVLCSFQEPPSPEMMDPNTSPSQKKRPQFYNPGGIYNCRCYAEPIIDIDLQLRFPVKVVWKGQIVRMSKKQFLEIA